MAVLDIYKSSCVPAAQKILSEQQFVTLLSLNEVYTDFELRIYSSIYGVVWAFAHVTVEKHTNLGFSYLRLLLLIHYNCNRLLVFDILFILRTGMFLCKICYKIEYCLY